MQIIGLTGGIGAGKSTVTERLTKLGYKVIDADKIAREIVLPGEKTLLELEEAFGSEIIFDDGTLNRKKLADIVFSDFEKKELLDRLMHGKINEIVKDRIAIYENEEFLNIGPEGSAPLRHSIVFLDAPLLLETGLDKLVNKIWVVDADEGIRRSRIIERDGLSEEEIGKRISSQMNRQDKRDCADEVLDNSGTIEELHKQIDQLLYRIGS